MKRNYFLIVLCVCNHLLQSQDIKVTQVKDQTFVISMTKPLKNTKFSWSSLPDSWKKSSTLRVKENVDTLVLASVHPIVRADNKSNIVYASTRAIGLQGAVNFRDLGGYQTASGKQVRWGKIYRSADISKLTDADLKVLTSLNLNMVCDLRGESESDAAPDKLPEGVNHVLLSAGSENIGAPGSFMKYMKSEKSADSLIMSIYTRTDHLGKKYKPMFDQLLLLERDHSLLLHCTAGKDRTGIGAALILYALGVRESDILKDYELTNEYRKEVNQTFIKGLMSQGLPEKAATSMMAANPEYLKAAFESIRSTYGSVDLFLKKEMGLTNEGRNLLQMRFLY